MAEGHKRTERADNPSPRAWCAFAGCCLLCAAAFGLPLLCFGVFVSPLVANFGSSVTDVNLYYTFMTGSAVLSCALGERILSRFMRATVLAGSVLMGAAYGLLAMMPAIPMVWLAGLVAGLCYPLCSSVLAPILINQWFSLRQGFLTGIAFAVVGVAGMVVSPLLAQAIALFGWQWALSAMGVAIALCGIVAACWLVRPNQSNGAEVACKDGRTTGSRAKGAADSVKLTTFRSFTPVAIACVLCGFVGIMNTQINAVAQQSGFDAMTAATVLSCMSGGLLAGKIGLGLLKDAKNGVVAIASGAALGIVGFALMIAGLMQGAATVLFMGAALAGFATCLGTVAPALLMGEAFPPACYGKAVAVGTSFINGGMALSAPLYSLTFDGAGTYVPVVAACIAAAAAIALLCRAAARSRA
ncbi:MFS transporter [Adlercreutzia sp. ZJ473]|uniref:MFS transporter n=1 Tax=Adlercreutzia sp. ZJ473 TaxID=2722822 RepID=UPI0015564B13|nr:MFS transporter [Adlercreutzia sp. ZJ473]